MKIKGLKGMKIYNNNKEMETNNNMEKIKNMKIKGLKDMKIYNNTEKKFLIV